jgi:peptidoglycan L-alanyl-D-glutamate endopeptidase CwlK
MSYKFGKKSKRERETLHDDLKRLLDEIIKYYDFSIIEGYRSNERQNQMFKEEISSKIGGESKHNIYPSQAVDIAPYPIDWNDLHRFYHFIGYVKATAKQLGINIRCGADWDNDNNFKDQTFNDLNHIELINIK